MALPPLMPSSVNAGDELFARQQLLVGARRPPEQCQEVHHRLGKIAQPRWYSHHGRRAVPLAQPFPVGPENERHAREPRLSACRNALKSMTCFGVFEMWSSPLTTSVISISTSSDDDREVVGRVARRSGG